MQHPRDIIVPEYNALLPSVRIDPARFAAVDGTAQRLIGFHRAGRYARVNAATGVPEIFMATSFERESSSDFRCSPAQGDPWDRPSINVPKNRGPFPDWDAAADDAYHLNGLDEVGAANWTWGLFCYYAELFNGFGYRDYHHERSPYVFGATNLQQIGKYTSDGTFDPTHMDEQLGVLAMAIRIGELAPELRLPGWPFADTGAPMIVAPSIVPASTGMIPAFELQHDLNALGFGPLQEDGNIGKITGAAIRAFQAAHHITVDGIAGPETDDAIRAALAAAS